MCKSINIIEVKKIMDVLDHGQHGFSGPQTDVKAMQMAEEHLGFLLLTVIMIATCSWSQQALLVVI